jgi:hypothetical protein
VHRKVRLILSLIVVLLTVTFATADETDRSSKVRQLRQEYRVTSDHVERLIIASKLAREGDYVYWSFVRGEAEKAIQHDKPRSHWWLFRRIHHIQSANYSVNYMVVPTPDPAPRAVREKLADKIDVSADTLDVWRMLAFASAAPRQERELLLLREGVRSPRPLIAAYAALGLARLRDQQSAEMIAWAGGRAKDAERVLFVEALVCLNDEKATTLAKQVAGDDTDVLRALQEQAPRKQYNPFAER